jgi:serine/threonine protein phosphatase PrpC
MNKRIIENLIKLKKNLEGTTSTIIIITNQKIIVSNIGDSKAILIKTDKVQQITYEHKSFDKDEMELIKSKDGFITLNGRVNGVIAVARAFGDIILQDVLSCEPYINIINIDIDDRLVVIGCDGVWDVLNNDDIKIINVGEMDCAYFARLIRNLAFSLGSTDNITSLVVNLKILRKFFK